MDNAIKNIREDVRFKGKIESVALMSDLEKAKVEGFRAQAAVFFKYITGNKSIKEGINEFREDFRDSSKPMKAFMIFTAPAWIPINLGVGAAIAGVKSVDFFRRLKESKDFQDSITDAEARKKLDEMIQDYQEGTSDILNPYDSSSSFDSDVMDLQEMVGRGK